MYIDFISTVIERLNESGDQTAVERGDLILTNNDLIRRRIEHARWHGIVAMFATEVPRQINGTVVVGKGVNESFDERIGFDGFDHGLLAFDLSR